MYLMCRNTRLNPESSAPLVQVTSLYSKNGMAANVEQCLKELGVRTSLVTSKECSIKRRYVNAKSKEQLLRVDFDPKIEPLLQEELDIASYNRIYDAIVIADYDKGFLTYSTINYIADNYSGPVFLDTKKKELERINSKIFLKINEHEANAAIKVPDHTIVTMGASGVIWYNDRWPAYKTEMVDVCGAGDAFMAGIVYGYLTDNNNMIEYGIVNGGLSVRHLGTYSPSLKELKEGLNEYLSSKRS